MKYFLIKIFVFIFFITYSNAQEIKTKSSTSKKLNNLPELSSVIKESSWQTTEWALCIQYKSEKPIAHEQMETVIDTFGVYSPPAEYQQALKYRNEMKDAFQWFTVYCDNIASFLPSSSNRKIPFRFAKKEDKICVLLSDMASSHIYNTLRLTSKGRASKILESCLLPKIKYLYDAFKKTNINYFGFIIYYGSQDFSEGSYTLTLEPEMLAFIASSSNCEKFINGSITESEFVIGGESYLTDRDMLSGFKKVKLDIE